MSAPLKPHERQPDALWAGYENIMKTLREKLDRAGVADGKHYLPTAAVPASGRLLRDMEAFQVTKYPNVISCDLHGSWEPLLLLVLSGL